MGSGVLVCNLYGRMVFALRTYAHTHIHTQHASVVRAYHCVTHTLVQSRTY